LTANLRSTDVLGRLGGEEFAAILPNMNADEALAAADRVRRAFVEAAKEIDGHPVLGTLSAGVAVTTDSTMSVDALLSRADEALYTAKASGRNQVIVAGEKFAPVPTVTETPAAPKTRVLTVISGSPASNEAA
jgi:diguanylate cyclase (GGDEF)-like protein